MWGLNLTEEELDIFARGEQCFQNRVVNDKGSASTHVVRLRRINT